MLLSEDLRDGFSWNGVTVVNPFAKTPSPLVKQLLLWAMAQGGRDHFDPRPERLG
jgi:hypothetical protein